MKFLEVTLVPAVFTAGFRSFSIFNSAEYCLLEIIGINLEILLKNNSFSSMIPASSSSSFISLSRYIDMSFIASIMLSVLSKVSWCSVLLIFPNSYWKMSKSWDFRCTSGSAVIFFYLKRVNLLYFYIFIWFYAYFYFFAVIFFIVSIIFSCSFDFSGIHSFSYFFEII